MTLAEESSPTTSRRAEVLAWMAETGAGYKAAARNFGIARETIRAWRQQERADEPDGVAPPPAPAPAREDEASSELAMMGPVLYWRRRLDVALQGVDEAIALGHTGSAATWEKIASATREKLDEALKADEKQRRREAATEVRDPEALAVRLVAVLPRLLAVADRADLVDALEDAVREWRATR